MASEIAVYNDETHQGWKNYETFLIGIWIDNDARLLDTAISAVHRLKERHRIADRLRELVENRVPEFSGVREVMGSLIHAAILRVDWRALADHYIDKVREGA